jgi:uncharacterized protein
MRGNIWRGNVMRGNIWRGNMVASNMVAKRFVRSAAAGLIAATIAVLVMPLCAQAQQPSANSILLAREIINVKGAAKMYDPVIVEVVDRTTGILMQTNPTLYKDLDEVATRLRKEYAPRVSELLNEVARLYASRFSETELRDVLAFYKSPVGQKIIVQEPAILDQSITFSDGWASRFSEEVIAKIRAEMRRKGHQL